MANLKESRTICRALFRINCIMDTIGVLPL